MLRKGQTCRLIRDRSDNLSIYLKVKYLSINGQISLYWVPSVRTKCQISTKPIRVQAKALVLSIMNERYLLDSL